MNHTADSVRLDVEPHRARLLESLYLNQPANYSPDQRTKDLWVLGGWIDQCCHLNPDISNDMRLRAGSFFNRKARAAEDLFVLAAVSLNLAIAGTVEAVPMRR